MITKNFFGTTADGKSVDAYTLKNSIGTTAQIITYGARLASWIFNGVNVVLGYDNIAAYEKDAAYKGAIVGRCANRITAKIIFTADLTALREKFGRLKLSATA